ncbi:PaaI family thioesterase [Kutzneria viridogrisea]|uniref:Acyl-coenzyme A thioesterase THEM4 n=2 Tax=Kutzneria TaxID=43356 RepID=W5W538_9PSEU|nr:PaaI family thioesterase [Kutzneria albida]AHH96007.1 hypothetical protein KALB_2639 [Kutzneria albida DSM 43870]MBA8928791.1 acyl-coenzyme A thioesterase PaaI-like protein [Kutzneria viridogrisea]
MNSIELPADAELPSRHPKAPAPGTELPVHYQRCFGCGDVDAGLHLKIRAGEGLTVTGLFQVTEHHQGAPGLAHGGLLAAAFDETLGSLNWLLHTTTVTGRLETDFRRPVPVDSTLHILAKVDGLAGRKLYVSAEGRLNAVDGPLALTARGLFVKVGIEHFVKHGRPQDIAEAVDERGFEVNP